MNNLYGFLRGMMRIAGLWAAFLLVVSTAIAAPSSKPCVPSFSPQGGWLGADAAYSIPMSGGRVVWIFGDTLYGKERVVNGDIPRMVRNSIGISTCDPDKGWNIDYVIRRDKDGRLRDFFESPDKNHWYWALDQEPCLTFDADFRGLGLRDLRWGHCQDHGS